MTGPESTALPGMARLLEVMRRLRDPRSGCPWDVKQDARIRLDGRGLLLASGNAVGSNANASVFATLFCANDGNIQHSSNLAGVPLEVNGDFRIDDTLSPVPPNPCTSPVLLIRSAGSGSWFAAGIPR